MNGGTLDNVFWYPTEDKTGCAGSILGVVGVLGFGCSFGLSCIWVFGFDDSGFDKFSVALSCFSWKVLVDLRSMSPFCNISEWLVSFTLFDILWISSCGPVKLEVGVFDLLPSICTGDTANKSGFGLEISITGTLTPDMWSEGVLGCPECVFVEIKLKVGVFTLVGVAAPFASSVGVVPRFVLGVSAAFCLVSEAGVLTLFISEDGIVSFLTSDVGVWLFLISEVGVIILLTSNVGVVTLLISLVGVLSLFISDVGVTILLTSNVGVGPLSNSAVGVLLLVGDAWGVLTPTDFAV